MTSNELKDALNRRLNKVDSTSATPPDSSSDTGRPSEMNGRASVGSEEAVASGVKSPNPKVPTQTFRSGWSNTPQIHRSNALPYGQFLPPPPLKSDKLTPKPSAKEINSGLVDQRRKDLSSASSSSVGDSDPRPKNGSNLPLVAAKLLESDSVVKEGYLSKFSSGALTSRWQKRYFILKESGLEYFGKHSLAKTNGPSVQFPVHRLKSVSKSANEKEFEIVIGRKNRRQYQLKAASSELCGEWIAAIEQVMNRYHSSRVGGDGSDNSDISVDIDESDMGGSSLNDNSSSVSTGERNVNVASTLWEQPDVSEDELDALFSEWFRFLEDPRAEIKAGRMIDASSRAVSDLWAVLGKLPRGEDVQFEEAKLKIAPLYKPGLSNVTVGEYVMRLCQKVIVWLNRRPLNPEEIPVVIEWMLRFKGNLESLCCESIDNNSVPASAPSSPTHSDGGSILSAPERFRNALKTVVRKLGSEWEIGTIEQIQRSMPSESIWDFPSDNSCVSSTALPHGPANVVYDGALPGAPRASILATSWSKQFFDLLSSKCLSRCTSGNVPWHVAFPTCLDLLTAHASSVIVAAMNACHREFKKRISLYASHGAGGGRVGSMIKKVKHLISASTPSPTKSDPQDFRPPTPPAGQAGVPPFCVARDHMIAFGNESTLLSVACQHIADLKAFKSASPVFTECLQDLSKTFANTANEVSRLLVKVHFLKKNEKILRGAFDPKLLAVRVKVPISDTLDEARAFLAASPGVHQLLNHLIIGHVMQGVANAYVTSLVTHKPKMSKFTRLAAVVAEDEGLFFTMFKSLGRAPTEINTANDQISHIRIVLSEKNLAPPSRGGIPLVHECVELTKAFASSKRALEVVKALLHIKGVNKTDRKDILFSVTACSQRNIQSPSPAILDLSREDDDDDEDEMKDDSGISSNRSDHKATDDSF